MPFSFSDLGFIDDALDSLMGGLDDLFSTKEERKKVEKAIESVRAEIKANTQAHARKMAKLAVEDRQSARAAQGKAFNRAWWIMPTLSILSFVGFFAILFVLTFTEVTAAKQPLYIMLGTLGTIVTQIAQFFFGSSQGSKDKDNRIAEQLARIDERTNKDAGAVSNSTERETPAPEVRIDVPEELPDQPEGRVGW